MLTPDKLTLGVWFPIEAYQGPNPTMQNQERRAAFIEAAGFESLWFRDVPLLDPDFGDIGQIYDPWVYMGYMAAKTSTIRLATGSIILPLRPPLDLAKQAASVDQLSGGRLVLGVATGDRAVEFAAYDCPEQDRGERFREAVQVMRRAWSESYPVIHTPRVRLAYADTVPKPVNGTIPVFITGHSRQSLEWIAEHGDGWLTYPRPMMRQLEVIAQWRAACAAFKPMAQSLHIDLASDPDESASPIHLGIRAGRNVVLEHLKMLEQGGMNHVAINLKQSKRDVDEVLEEIATHILPHFKA